jgi:hypothetical protein
MRIGNPQLTQITQISSKGRVLPVRKKAAGCESHFSCLIAQSDPEGNLRNPSNLWIIHLCVLCVSVVK